MRGGFVLSVTEASLLAAMQLLDPISGRSHGQSGLIDPAVKGGIALGIIFCTFVLFGQAARYYIHLVKLLPPTSLTRLMPCSFVLLHAKNILLLGLPLAVCSLDDKLHAGFAVWSNTKHASHTSHV